MIANRLLRLLALFAATSTSAQQTDGPPPVYSFGLAYDDARQRLVMFGGYMQGAYPADTWEWDGARWTRVSQSGPPGRNSPRMVYDASRAKVIMFGGDTREGAFGDTWEWDGNTWTQIAGDGPPARSVHGMAYDSRRQRTVVFGGRSGNDFRTDTWELDRNGWKKVADAGPPPRMIFGMAYDAKLQKTVVIGGNRAAGPPSESDVLGDVWTWDGARWEQLTGSGPGARDHLAATYDPISEGLMVVGGARIPSGTIADAWTLTNGRWNQLSIGALGGRAGHNMVTDFRNRRVLLYGGFVDGAPVRELWEYSSAGWKRLW